MKKSLRFLILLATVCAFAASAFAQRKMEVLDRGLVAVKVNSGVFLSWRIQGYEWYNTTYNVYRDGAKINTEPLSVSNYSDLSGTVTSSYTVTAIVKGVEQSPSAQTKPLSQQYLEVPLKARDGNIYQINDMTAADLDGDGQYELIVKRIVKDWTVACASFAYFEAYKLDGTFLWEINVGPNIMPDVEINIAAFDFDEDGKAEVFMRTSEGTIFGDGKLIGDTNADGLTNYRYSVVQSANMEYMNAGPEFLSLIDGVTGAELDRVDFIPRGQSSDWGDNYGHRASKYFFGAPYLDGKKPSLFIGRGIYTKTIMRTYDVVNKKLVFRWEFNSGNSGPYYSQGNHNYTIADTDGDGCDEIAWGSMVVDNTGQGLFSTQFGHGDALHVGDLDPYHKGIEIFKCIEDSPNWGTALYDGATGKVFIHHYTTYDCGRCCAANVSDAYKGAELWGGNKMFSATTHKQVGTGSLAENYRIYWDGDLLEELTDHVNFSTGTGYGTGAIMKHGVGTILTAAGLSCNYTKGTPSLQADLFGDWREEVIWRRADNQAVRIYTTIDPTIYRNYSLMHDHQYRQAICWQMCGYNQPPHVSYFLGKAENITVPPPPAMSNFRLVYKGSGVWDKSSTVWNKDGVMTQYVDGQQVLFDVSSGLNVSLSLSETVSPDVTTVNSRGNYAIDASAGKMSGDMILAKQGAGTFTLNGSHDFTGNTSVWDGKMVFNGELSQSPVWLNLHTQMEATGKLSKGVAICYNAQLSVGEVGTAASLTIGDNLTIEEGGVFAIDLAAPVSANNDLATLNGNLVVSGNAVIKINPILTGGATKLEPGEYTIFTFSGSVVGDLSKVQVVGIESNLTELVVKDGKLLLLVKDARSAATLVWNGALNSAAWDFGATQNFTNGDLPDLFLNGDNVWVTDAAASKTINVTGRVSPASITVNGSSDFIIAGTGTIIGNATLTKTGSGKLTIANDNEFTGKVLVTGGTLEMTNMPNLSDLSGIGPVSSVASNLEINGGKLSLLGDMHTTRAAYIGSNGATIECDGKLYWEGNLSGGVITKNGNGNLYFGGTNSISSVVLNAGTITRMSDNTSTGSKIVFNGGVFQDNDDSYSYTTNSVNFEIPSGMTGTANLDSRCYYTGALIGAGTFNIYIPYVRTDLNGNWSAFAGTLNVGSGTGSSVDGRFGNSNGLPNATVNIGANVNAYSILSGVAIKLGALTGTGNLTGDHTWEIGNKNTDCQFSGLISAGSITKVGTGTFTLSGANTYGGATIIKGGRIVALNSSGSATGNGAVSILSGGELSGSGIVSGAVYVESGGTLYGGHTSVGSKLTISKLVTMKSGSNYSVKVNALFQLADRVVATTGFVANGQLTMVLSGGAYAAGKSFKVIESSNISGAFTSISPATPGAGLVWDTSELYTSGIIKVAAQATGIGSVSVDPLSTFPNPTSGVVHFNVPVWGDKVVVRAETLSGNLLLEKDLTGNLDPQIDLSGQPQGIYVIKVLVDNRLFVGKTILK